MLGIFTIESKTHVVVMDVVSQHLDEYKNNGLICKLQEILSGLGLSTGRVRSGLGLTRTRPV